MQTSEKGSKLEIEVCTQASETRIAKKDYIKEMARSFETRFKEHKSNKKSVINGGWRKPQGLWTQWIFPLNTTSAQEENNLYLPGRN